MNAQMSSKLKITAYFPYNFKFQLVKSIVLFKSKLFPFVCLDHVSVRQMLDNRVDRATGWRQFRILKPELAVCFQVFGSERFPVKM